MPAAVRCKLFSDMVSEHLCLLRKKELNAKGAFSCDGCPMASFTLGAGIERVLRDRVPGITEVVAD